MLCDRSNVVVISDEAHRSQYGLKAGLKQIKDKETSEVTGAKYINQRLMRRTELQEKFPSHVVDEWMGHSTATVEKHYLQVIQDPGLAEAALLTGEIEYGGPINAHQGYHEKMGALKNPAKSRV